MNNRQVNGNWAIGGEAYDIARVPGGAASKGEGGGTEGGWLVLRCQLYFIFPSFKGR